MQNEEIKELIITKSGDEQKCYKELENNSHIKYYIMHSANRVNKGQYVYYKFMNAGSKYGMSADNEPQINPFYKESIQERVEVKEEMPVELDITTPEVSVSHKKEGVEQILEIDEKGLTERSTVLDMIGEYQGNISNTISNPVPMDVLKAEIEKAISNSVKKQPAENTQDGQALVKLNINNEVFDKTDSAMAANCEEFKQIQKQYEKLYSDYESLNIAYNELLENNNAQVAELMSNIQELEARLSQANEEKLYSLDDLFDIANGMGYKITVTERD